MGWVSKQFELSRGGPAQNMLPMEGLRGFAVFLVFLVHYSTLIAQWITPNSRLADMSHALHSMGNAGVDLFFVLSGYLIYGSLIKRNKKFDAFIRQRIARIYPAFCVVFVIYLALSFLFPSESKIPAAPYSAALYILQNFLLLPGLFPIEPMITVAWSLSYEMFYYLIIPAMIALVGLRTRTAQWRVAFFVALAMALCIVCVMHGGPVRLIMFIAGILLHEALVTRPLIALRSRYAALVLIAGLAATVIPVAGPASEPLKALILSVAFFALCYVCFSQPCGTLGRAFSWTPLRWLGNMSYSYYLLHGLALKLGFRLLHDALPSVSQESLFFLAMLVPMFILTLVPTVVLFVLVERPFSLAKMNAVPAPQHTARNAA